MAVWIRPLGAHKNTQDGTSYDTAYLGLKNRNIPWTDGTQDLYICGAHLPPLYADTNWPDIHTRYAVTSIAGGASAQRKRIIRGDMVPGDPGVIHCGLFQETNAWENMGGGVWRKQIWDIHGRAWGGGHVGGEAPATAVFEYDGTDYTWLNYCCSIAECTATAGSTFVAGTGDFAFSYSTASATQRFVVGEVVTGGTSGASATVKAVRLSGTSVQLTLDGTTWNFIAFAAGEQLTGDQGGGASVHPSTQYLQGNGQRYDWWYVHTTDGLSPANRVCRPGWGWNIARRVPNCIWYGLKFVGFQSWSGGNNESDDWITDGMEIRRCTFDMFGAYAMITLPGKNRDVIVDRCEIAWGENGIYQFSSNSQVPAKGRDAQNIRITRCHIHDIGRKERSTITADNHAIGHQNGDGLLVEGNVFERCGNMVVAWCGWSSQTTARMKNIVYRYNVSADSHDEGNFQFRHGYEITDQRNTSDSEGADCSGNKIEYCVARISTAFVGMHGIVSGQGLEANICPVRYCYIEGGRHGQTQGSARRIDTQHCTFKDPADYFVYNGSGNAIRVTFDYNTYIGNPAIADFHHNGNKTFAQWQAAGQDVNGTRV